MSWTADSVTGLSHLSFIPRHPASGCRLLEPRELAHENKWQLVDRTVSLFRDDQIGLRSLFLGDFALFLEQVRTVNEQHYVGILLDRARITQVGQLRAARLMLRGARELAEHDHGNLQFLGQPFQSPLDT